MARPPKKRPPRSRYVSSPPKGPPASHSGSQEAGEGERLQKALAAAGVASRRQCEQLILEGRVEVDGQVVAQLGTRVDPSRQQIRVDGQPLARPKLVYFAVHKPVGVVATARDPAGRPRVTDLLPRHVGRVFCVGRLDLTSEGLILVTNDGELAARLTHPRHGVEKIYSVQVAGVPEADVLAQLRRGVHLAEGYAHAVDVRIKSRKKNSALLEMVLDEGRNREVRRLLARVGHKVQRLTRIAVGPVRLGELPRGAFRPLTPDELAKLRQAVDRPGPHRAARNKIAARPAAERPPTRGPADGPTALDQPGSTDSPSTRAPKRKIVGASAARVAGTGPKMDRQKGKSGKNQGRRRAATDAQGGKKGDRTALQGRGKLIGRGGGAPRKGKPQRPSGRGRKQA